MENYSPIVTSAFTKITESPYYVLGSGDVFTIVKSYAKTSDLEGIVTGDKDLYLGKDIQEVENPGKFRLNFLLSEYPGNLFEALRNYAILKNCPYVSIDFPPNDWSLHDDGKVIQVTPRLFVPYYDTGVDLEQSFTDSLGIDSDFL